jgi:sensor histidine kinase regulating citrate/malate metabolism
MGLPNASLSLRAKAMFMTLGVIVAALAAFAAASTVQVNRLINSAQSHEAEAMAKSLAAACELPLSVLDTNELARLAHRFNDHQNVVFVAISDEKGKQLVFSASDQAAWSAFQRADRDAAEAVIGRCEVVAQRADANLDAIDDALPPGARPAAPQQRLGEVVVGLSTAPAKLARG